MHLCARSDSLFLPLSSISKGPLATPGPPESPRMVFVSHSRLITDLTPSTTSVMQPNLCTVSRRQGVDILGGTLSCPPQATCQHLSQPDVLLLKFRRRSVTYSLFSNEHLWLKGDTTGERKAKRGLPWLAMAMHTFLQIEHHTFHPSVEGTGSAQPSPSYPATLCRSGW